MRTVQLISFIVDFNFSLFPSLFLLLLLGEMLGLNFVGYDYDNHNVSYNMNNYGVGVIDSHAQTIKLSSISHIFTMNLLNKNEDEIPDNNPLLSNYERKHNLTDVFGTKKKKRVMKQMESNIISSDNITGVDAIHQAITVTIPSENQLEGKKKKNIEGNEGEEGENEEEEEQEEEGKKGKKGTESAAEQALELHREQMLPRYNLLGQTLNEVYPEADLIPSAVQKSIKEYLYKIQLELQEQITLAASAAESKPTTATSQRLELNTIKQFLREKGWVELCLELVDMVYAASFHTTTTTTQDLQIMKSFFKHLRMIYFLSCMLKFSVCLLSSNKRFTSREEFLNSLHHPPLPILKYLTDTFALHKKVQEVHSFQTTKTHS